VMDHCLASNAPQTSTSPRNYFPGAAWGELFIQIGKFFGYNYISTAETAKSIANI